MTHLSLPEVARKRIIIAIQTNATRLFLNDKALKELPQEISEAHSLRVLDLTGNQLTEFPEVLCSLKKLKVLRLGYNKISRVGHRIGELKNLTELNFKNNSLNYLPEEISSIKNLESLNLSHNKLRSIPPSIGSLENLRSLNIENNPLPISHFRALEDGPSNFLTFLSSLSQKTRPIYEAKLLVTGEGMVGKSWLLAALGGANPSVQVGEENTTWGIDRDELTLPHPALKNINIHFNTWDFGGQEVYRSTHQFFFSEQAIYLLVWNPRQGAEQCRVANWLRTIALRTGYQQHLKRKPRAKVIMVATHADEKGGSYNPDFGYAGLEKDLQELIVDTIAVDSRTGKNIELLKTKIAQHAAQLPEMGDRYNEKWLETRDKITAQGALSPWITFRELSEICQKQSIEEPSDQISLARILLNRVGKAVWYGTGSQEASSKSVDFYLDDTVVLDAVWLTRAFVQILQDEETAKAGGMLDHSRLSFIWTNHNRKGWREYPSHDYIRLTRMMRHFDVALPTANSLGEKSLVPQLVPHMIKTLPWKDVQSAPGRRNLRMTCNYYCHVEGLMPRIIAAMEKYHVYNGGVGLFWKKGIFLKDEVSFSNEALLTLQGDEKPILTIEVSGDQPGFFANQIFEIINHVNSFWQGLECTHNIVCPTARDDKTLCTGEFNRETIYRRISYLNNRSLSCQICDQDYNPTQLIFGLNSFNSIETEAFEEIQGISRVTQYLFERDRTPCPRVFMLKPVQFDLKDIKSWQGLTDKKVEISLLSEYSGKKVISKIVRFEKEWVNYLRPVLRLSSLLLAGLAMPLEGEVAADLTSASTIMNKLSTAPEFPQHDEYYSRSKNLDNEEARVSVSMQHIRQLHQFLLQIGLDPLQHGMDIVQLKTGDWKWMTYEECAAHRVLEASI